MGIKPTHASSDYGYLHAGVHLAKVPGGFSCNKFAEKPSPALAKKWLRKRGIFWNSGIFVSHLQSLLHAFALYLPKHMATLSRWEALSETERLRTFENLPAISLDYGIMEKAKNLLILRADFRWSDLGSWPAIEKISERLGKNHAKGRARFLKSSENFVFAPHGLRWTLVGLDDLVAIQGEEDVLLIRKTHLPGIKNILGENS